MRSAFDIVAQIITKIPQRKCLAIRYNSPIPSSAFLIGLTLLASLSPLLTFAWLWQVKEWRWDRLEEHLRREGWMRTLIGRVRGLLILLYFCLIFLGLVGVALTGGGPMAFVAFISLAMTIPWWLGIFAVLSALQILSGRQRYPIWTQKSVLLVFTALILTGIATKALLFQSAILLIPFLVVLQPLSLFLSWILWKPPDELLKNRVFRMARELCALHPDLTVIGITGSVGKTTTKELLKHLLQDLHPLATPAYVNTEMGVAQWMLRELPRFAQERGSQKKIMIVEMGTYKMGEITLLSSIVQQNIGVLTAITNQHVAIFGSQENLTQAKTEILVTLPKDGHAFVNGDNALVRTMIDRSPCPVTTVGIEKNNQMIAENVRESAQGIRLRYAAIDWECPLHGAHNITNILLALAVAEHVGIKRERLRVLLRLFAPMQKTFSVREENGVRILDDTHNSSEASVRAAIDWAKTQPERSKVLLMASLIELGKEELQIHRELGAYAKGVFDRVIFTGERYAKEFSEGFGKSIEVLEKNTQKIESESLLVCSGRMSINSVDRLLPLEQN